jgi:putative toxin-antitoxin system antitoxin component (TIGR02293 family)
MKKQNSTIENLGGAERLKLIAGKFAAYSQEFKSISTELGSVSKGAQAIAVEIANYSKKSFEDSTAAIERLFGVKSLEKAIEMQTEYAKISYEGFVAKASKIGELYADLAKETYKPFETMIAKATPNATNRSESKSGPLEAKQAIVQTETIVHELPSTDAPNAPIVRVAPVALKDLTRFGYSEEEISELVVSKQALALRTSGDPLTVEETDKALRLKRIAAQTERTFGDATKANRWLRKPKRELGELTPLNFLASEAGARKVEEMLLRIEHGIFA